MGVAESQTNNITATTEPPSSITRIAIVGGGPKGMYGLERLVAEFTAQPPEQPIEIHIFNKTEFFGSGDVYRSDQPHFLKMNVPNNKIDIWIRQNPLCPIQYTPTFPEWLKDQNEIDNNLNEHDYSARAVVGLYLEAGFKSLLDHLPGQVTVHLHIGTVKDLKKANEGYVINYLNGDNIDTWSDIAFDHILLSTGHPSRHLSEEEKKWKESGFIPFIYPVEPVLDSVSPGSKVGLKGMGLTFVDAVLSLTEGREGKFISQEGNLVYQPSGLEPQKIYPFSRTSIPMIARGPELQEEYDLQFFTEDAVNHFERPDFELDLLPLIKQEMVFMYYAVLFDQHQFSFSLPNSFKDLEDQIENFHQQQKHISRFNIDKYLYPVSEHEINDGAEMHNFTLNYIKKSNKEAAKGTKKSAWAAVSQVWSLITPLFIEIFKFGGLKPESHKNFITNYSGLLNRITYGPPVENMCKIVALAECGILDFSIGPCSEIKNDRHNENFEITSKINHAVTSVDYLIDARIPKVSIEQAQEGLYFNLLQRGEIKLFENNCEQEETVYKPGCMAIDPFGYIVNNQGHINNQIAATGAPTEGVTYDNDALSPHRNNFVSIWAKNIVKELKSHQK
ncbi:FAD/NAD(P)-binding protein [Fulvivirga ligni]|uniref:FAD/NAD(P)-binding protein n=1 Tax=Fulvivirga ligni TaxID=2904246 RepID=UPI001F313D3F|nr:FAD/NAD(P)-binding protein [Fulvivirga ligni]UII19703.1 FAD/NAD(P)-binding protein [Fulvivirga ligni]